MSGWYDLQLYHLPDQCQHGAVYYHDRHQQCAGTCDHPFLGKFGPVAVDGNIVGYTGGTAFGGVSNSLDVNYDLVGGFTMTSARSVNTLRIESSADDQILNLGTNGLTMSNHGGTTGTGQGF